ncbi:hypothetical protein CA13_65380 [Planctomycetes bacterium CA13]|uniref:Uncharacterized protein n=1 Tax=Novipirellula herctigrandis TaxID=2527986 RepID=A0A5C5ZCZ8_9BACT|nr:hypothetical protein CA13_65380 [Planctomycetes bacterium CA13]
MMRQLHDLFTVNESIATSNSRMAAHNAVRFSDGDKV